MVICIRYVIGDSHEVGTYFFYKVELNCTTAESIKNIVIYNLSKYDINLECLKKNFVGLVSDGVSKMLSRKAGSWYFKNIFLTYVIVAITD